MNFCESPLILAMTLTFILDNNSKGLKDDTVADIAQQYAEYFEAFLQKDPAARGDLDYLIYNYRNHYALMGYRLPHALWEKKRYSDAPIVQEAAERKTGIEIHLNAKIGLRFGIDHGIARVIGETVEIGDDAYILQNVILVSSRIVGTTGDRHPTLGHNVEIAGISRLFGPIVIGDNVKISPYAVITEDIPSNSLVIVKIRFKR